MSPPLRQGKEQQACQSKRSVRLDLDPSRACKPVFDEHLHRERHRIENLFARLKANRRIATRYEKLHGTFAALVWLACLLVWLKY